MWTIANFLKIVIYAIKLIWSCKDNKNVLISEILTIPADLIVFKSIFLINCLSQWQLVIKKGILECADPQNDFVIKYNCTFHILVNCYGKLLNVLKTPRYLLQKNCIFSVLLTALVCSLKEGHILTFYVNPENM